MKWFLDLKLGTKLISAFLVIAIIGAYVGYEGMTSLKESDDNDTIMYEQNVKMISAISDIRGNFQRQRVHLLELILAKTDNERRELKKKITERTDEITKSYDEIEKKIQISNVKDEYNTLIDIRKDFHSVMEKLQELAMNGKTNEALAYWKGEFDQSRTKYMNEQIKMDDLLVDRAGERNKLNSDLSDSSIMLMLYATIFSFLS
ncbi:MAG: MCP four helix bundle domain-containing protein, partial [Bacteroidetes bacterium]|nr:MCP four helix bundle domain-containing protein [Bacteroidota bacterium]